MQCSRFTRGNNLEHRQYGPTVRDALFFPASDADVCPSGMVAAAIFVIDIEEVFVARIASGLSSADNDLNIVCFRERFSDTAYEVGCM